MSAFGCSSDGCHGVFWCKCCWNFLLRQIDCKWPLGSRSQVLSLHNNGWERFGSSDPWWCLLISWDQRTQEEFSDTYPIPSIYIRYIKKLPRYLPQPLPAKRWTPPTSSSICLWFGMENCHQNAMNAPLGTEATLLGCPRNLVNG